MNITLVNRPLALGDIKHSALRGGGQSIFLGRIRPEKSSTLGNLINLEYHIHEKIAFSQLEKIANWGIIQGALDVQILHSYGIVPVSDISLIVSICSVHRREGLLILEKCIDRIKKEVPIWKQEHFDKGSQWPPGHPIQLMQLKK